MPLKKNAQKMRALVTINKQRRHSSLLYTNRLPSVITDGKRLKK